MDKLILPTTGDISGNVGSCQTFLTEEATYHKGVFIENTVRIATNSCNGDISRLENWHFTGIWALPILAFLTFLVIESVRVCWFETVGKETK